jgi:hypothetical protein
VTALAGPITVPSGVPAGDQYRLVFVTSTSTPATSADIAYYNAFATNAASLEPALQSLGTTWTALASTATVDAYDNTNTDPMSLGVPIYNLAGQLVANSNPDLWDGSLSASISYDEHGAPPLPGYTQVWTGTGSTGVPDGPADALGSLSPVWGDSKSATSNWIDAGYYGALDNHTIYAISGILTVLAGDLNHDGIVNGLDVAFVASHWLVAGSNPAGPNGDAVVNGLDIAVIASHWLQTGGSGAGSGAAVPEASTITLAGVGALVLLIYRRRRA